jgi:hypothetical protein
MARYGLYLKSDVGRNPEIISKVNAPSYDDAILIFSMNKQLAKLDLLGIYSIIEL